MGDLPGFRTLFLVIIQWGPTRWPYPLSDDHKSGVPHINWYPEDMTKCWGAKRKKGIVHNAGARQVFKKYGHPYIFLKKGTTHHPAVKWSLKKLGTQCGDFYGHPGQRSPLTAYHTANPGPENQLNLKRPYRNMSEK